MRLRAAVAVVAASALAIALFVVVGAGAQGGGQQSRAFFAVLTGAKEVSPGGDRGAGDSNGRGSFSAVFDGRRLCYGLTNKDIQDPIAAHIHVGSAREAGDVVITLEQPSSGDPGASSACVRVARPLVRAILADPADYYVNVHTGDFPGGAVRGQLFARQR
jgi:CHRD domain